MPAAAKKLTQTKLTFLLKPKTTAIEPDGLSMRKRQSSDEVEILTKKSKLDAEPVSSAPRSYENGNVEPQVVLVRCDNGANPVGNEQKDINTTSSNSQVDIGSALAVEPDSSTPDCPLVTVLSSDSEPESDSVPNDSPSSVTDTRTPTKSSSSKADNGSPECDTPRTPLVDLSAMSTPTPVSSTTKVLSSSARKRSEAYRLQMEEKRKKREAEQEEKRQLKLKQKAEKEKEIEEKKRLKAEQKERERLEKQREREEKQREKELLLRQKQEELDAKNVAKEAERKKKEEERLQKEEEKRKKDEEKRRLEEEKLKKLEARQSAFINFFKKPEKKSTTEVPLADDGGRFKAYQVPEETRLAPIIRRDALATGTLDKYLHSEDGVSDYLSTIKAKRGRTAPATWPCTEKEEDEVVYVNKNAKLDMPGWYKAKFYQFHTDVRPAYFGTYRKRSATVRPRRPFTEDDQLDYEEDSADEWEEEEPGENIESGDEDEEEKDAYDFDPELREDGFLVDHNYLSDDEGAVSDPDDESLAAKKTKQMIARTYGKRHKKKLAMRPTVYGEVWQDEDDTDPVDHHIRVLAQFTAIVFARRPIGFDCGPQFSPASNTSRTVELPAEAMSLLITMTHGRLCNRKAISSDFLKEWAQRNPNSGHHFSAGQIRQAVRAMAVYEKRPAYRKLCWYVSDEYLSKYNLTDLPVPNPAAVQCQPAPLSAEAIKFVIQKTHGNVNNKHRQIADEIVQEWSLDKLSLTLNEPITSAQVASTIKRIAVYEKKPEFRRKCWYVQEAELESHGLTHLPIPHPSYQERLTPTPAAPEILHTPKVSGGQKRLTDFVKSVEKKPKLDDGCMVVSPTATPVIIPVTPSSTEQKQEKTTPRRVNFTTLKGRPSGTLTTNTTVATSGDSVANSPARSPRRVFFQTISRSADTAGSNPVAIQKLPDSTPRRVPLMTILPAQCNREEELDLKK